MGSLRGEVRNLLRIKSLDYWFLLEIWWRHQIENVFGRYWPFVKGIHRSPVDSPHKSQWRRALKFSLICAWTNDWANDRDAGDLRRHRPYYDVTVMIHQNKNNHSTPITHNSRKSDPYLNSSQLNRVFISCTCIHAHVNICILSLYIYWQDMSKHMFICVWGLVGENDIPITRA